MTTKRLFPLIIILLSMVGTKTLAYDIAVKNAAGVNIFYNYINEGTELEVVGCPSSTVVIPEEVTFMNRTRKVTSIGYRAFYHRDDLTSVTIPSTVNRIGWDAFYGTSLTSVTIPSSVTYIGGFAFYYCKKLTSVTILCGKTIIGERAFYFCSGLTSVHISDLESWCSIYFDTYYDAKDYKSNPLYNAQHLFLKGKEIKDLVIPDSVSSIKSGAFYGCKGLTSVTIPNHVKSIGEKVFAYCDIPKVVSKIENPYDIDINTFSDNTFFNATLYVPEGTIEKYKATEGWKKFKFIEEGNGN